MKTKDNFPEGAKVTNDGQTFGSNNSKGFKATGDSPNDDVKKK
ncbi:MULTISPECIES: hypothetical protein [Bacillaceae]|uniref:Uncharacterized protein n=1 Tax=Bacillus infantis NRRL B-14911 TaxID=1367477 RepID=U5LD13_9BACI|nr:MULTISPECIES: hypothetical protein [Bacillus]AGX04626.1 hypothetical protein N288_13620 [Bacillus infantis NRRL B-14911]EAR68304.1 hypothetical protein B14911_26635 [Bacillus sp. NRRL B-14911]MDW2877696.1 hypothetical protein [Bacillus infantis]